MAIDTGFQFIQDTFIGTTFFNIDWFLNIIITIIICLIITRQVNDWKVLILPISILLAIIGLTPNILILIVAGIIFALEVLSLNTLTKLIPTNMIKKPKPIHIPTVIEKIRERYK